MRKYKLMFGMMTLVLVVAITTVVARSSIQTKDDSTYVKYTDSAVIITIPAGTNDRILAGETPKIVHNDIMLKLGSRDRLTFTNNDDVGHTIGLFFVDAGQTISQQFTRPNIYEGTCSFQGGGIRIVVEEA